MFYFRTRDEAKKFAKREEHYKFIDLGTDAPKRWAVKVLRNG